MPCRVILVIISILLISLNVHSQGYPGWRIVSCKRELSIADLLEIIRLQTGVSSSYYHDAFNRHSKIKINVLEEPLDNVLKLIFSGKKVQWCYHKENLRIFLGHADVGELPEALPRNVVGWVTDDRGRPIPAVSLIISQSGKWTFSDNEGKFFLKDVGPKDSLQLFRLGYHARELPIIGDTLHLKLEPLIIPLREVKVKGKIDDGASSVTHLQRKTLVEDNPGSVLNLLQGRASGLFISSTSGLPGGSYRIRLRGQNSLESICDPLIIVDGVLLPANTFQDNLSDMISAGQNQTTFYANSPFNLLIANDIADITILKDASACSLYGAKGANGVILIRSKQANPQNKGVDFQFSRGVGQAVKLNRYMDTRQYLDMRREGIRNDSRSVSVTDVDITRWDSSRYTDWQKEMIGNRGLLSDGYISITGGKEKLSYRVSGLYHREETLFPTNNFFYRKMGSNIMMKYAPNSRLGLNLIGNYTTDLRLLPGKDLTVFSVLPPNAPGGYKADHSLNFEQEGDNPYIYLLRTDNTKSKHFRTALNGFYTLGQNTVIRLVAGMGTWSSRNTQVTPASSFDPRLNIRAGHSSFYDQRNTTGMANFQVEWGKEMKAFTLSLNAGINLQGENELKRHRLGTGYTMDGYLDKPGAAGQLLLLSRDESTYLYRSYFSRVELKALNKFTLSLTGSRDGSNQLSRGKQFGSFGTVGFAWSFGKERIFRKFELLNYGKIRGSWGLMGNDRFIGNIGGNYVTIPNTDHPFSTPSYGWEHVRKAELGIDIGLLQDKISFTFNYYNNRSTDLLLTGRYQAPASFPHFPVSYPAVIENKGFEMSMELVWFDAGDFSWTTSFNISVPQMRLRAFPGISETVYRNRYIPGKSLDVLVGNRFEGIDPATGVYSFQNKLTGFNLGPSMHGGLQNNIRYKELELSFMVKFADQQNRNPLLGTTAPGMLSNQFIDNWSRWSKPGDDALVQRYTATEGSAAYEQYQRILRSDAALVNASFIRLQNLIMAYHFPPRLARAIGGKGCTAYFQLLNFFTVSGYAGRDAEIFGSGPEFYPSVRAASAGIKVSF
ncbi:SusC/RagA family TonB-linked outer membrane protein [Olivibacter jilunii]|uniref:SusC/RagA family TonB-linked outer membrane protein n=1 Tax=Olivibacter jilunii TaxID=985016 RepID=UPI001031F2D0|nr:SusC/RagA family TonB-linked outer membrane protein [Olivibacter jilunii]